jgi:hypothetical protein
LSNGVRSPSLVEREFLIGDLRRLFDASERGSMRQFGADNVVKMCQVIGYFQCPGIPRELRRLLLNGLKSQSMCVCAVGEITRLCFRAFRSATVFLTKLFVAATLQVHVAILFMRCENVRCAASQRASCNDNTEQRSTCRGGVWGVRAERTKWPSWPDGLMREGRQNGADGKC